MPDYLGTDSAIELQKRIYQRRHIIDGDKNLVNGARLINFLEPEITGWDIVKSFAEQDQLIGFPLVHAETLIPQIEEHLGTEWNAHIWHSLTGDSERVLNYCNDIVNSYPLPKNWSINSYERPDNQCVDDIQSLNTETGISPYPAYYTRSEVLPVLSTCIRNENGILIATASVANRYDPLSRLGGHVFAGNVSVSKQYRRRGLGKLANAISLIESQRRFNWNVSTEQVAPDNFVSRAMIEACGLDDSRRLG